ncbi:MAG: hypothetical protein ACO21V_08905, partial [Limnohabitans sp.]
MAVWIHNQNRGFAAPPAVVRPMSRAMVHGSFPSSEQGNFMSESFAALFEESLKRSEMRTGEVI